MITRNHDLRLRQFIQEFPRTLEFRSPGPLSQVPGDNHNIGQMSFLRPR